MISFVSTNSDVIQGLSDLIAIFIYGASALAFLFGITRWSQLTNFQHIMRKDVQASTKMSIQSDNLSHSDTHHPLSAKNIELLISLLEESGRVSTPDQRVALIQEIGLNPSLFKTFSLNPHEFSVSFVNTLISRFSLDTLRKLLTSIAPFLPSRKNVVALLLSEIN